MSEALIKKLDEVLNYLLEAEVRKMLFLDVESSIDDLKERHLDHVKRRLKSAYLAAKKSGKNPAIIKAIENSPYPIISMEE